MNHFRFYCTDTFNYFVLVWLFVKLCLATLANGKLLEVVCWRQYKFLSWIFFIYITLNFKKHILLAHSKILLDHYNSSSKMVNRQFLITYIFSVFLKFGACHIMCQWADFWVTLFCAYIYQSKPRTGDKKLSVELYGKH